MVIQRSRIQYTDMDYIRRISLKYYFLTKPRMLLPILLQLLMNI